MDTPNAAKPRKQSLTIYLDREDKLALFRAAVDRNRSINDLINIWIRPHVRRLRRAGNSSVTRPADGG